MLESSRELRIGVVGIGARCYLAAFADSSPVPARLVAAADTAPDAAERAERLLPEGWRSWATTATCWSVGSTPSS